MRWTAAATVAAVTLGVTAAVAPPATAAPVPRTVTMDVLPTVQVDGIVWDTVTVGDTVYAVGKFDNARPAGAAPGEQQTPRGNILAFDVRTGELNTSFAHTLDAQGEVVTASPDGSVLYVGGQFGSVDGVARSRIAAFSTATGALLPFAPQPNASVYAIAATADTVYFGGTFNMVGADARTRLAAVAPDGTTLPWAAKANGVVRGIAVNADRGRVVVGGSFSRLNGRPAYGLGALDTAGRTVGAFPVSTQVTASGGRTSAGIISLSGNSDRLYATGFRYQDPFGQLEGAMSFDWDGNVRWINSCHGDSYDAQEIGDAVYVASHAYNCEWAQSFPRITPDPFHFGLAWDVEPSTAYNTVDNRGWDYSAYHPSTLLRWYPDFARGSVAGQSVWTFTGDADYVVAGGEFPSVNGVAQQGLVRFGVHAVAPNAYGPQGLGDTRAAMRADRSVVVRAQTAWDDDDTTLRYELLRSGTVVARATRLTVGFWQHDSRPDVTFTDRPGAGTWQYTVRAVDPGGASVTGATATVTVR